MSATASKNENLNNDYIKFCQICGKRLILRNQRDILRRTTCSHQCRGIISRRKAKKINCICKICGKNYQCTVRSITCSPECRAKAQVERSYKYLNNNPRAYILHLIKKPKRKHLDIERMLELLKKQNGKCALSNIKMTFKKIPNINKIHTNLSIDKIDPSKGYEIENIQFVCAIVNIMKLNLSVNEFIDWCNKIVNYNRRL